MNGVGKHTLTFATTPKMSTYLVAFLVGDFECTSGKSDGVPIRACATPGKKNLTKFAVESAKYMLHYYDTYFGIKYPMPKLDMVALPDFEAGAMENFGCITYRETDLLLDKKIATIPSQKYVALVVAHEMAHQWFGDMVTMQWWDNIWLNEGFATWMETKPLAAWHPEWNISQDEAQSLDTTLNSDSGKTTRTIRAEANTPSEINELFDDIAYGKAGAVLGMVENYLGQETFRQGVHNYLAAHLYANATAEDFWSAQTANSHQPVDQIMQSFVTQPGVPLLSLAAPTFTSIAATQTRFYLSPNSSSPAGQWTIPVCLKPESAPTHNCQLLTPDKDSLTLAQPSSPNLFANAAAKGYYRTHYTPTQFTAITTSAETSLAPAERINFLGDSWALVNSAQLNVGDFLSLVFSLKQDPNAAVLETALGRVRTINNRIATTDDSTRLAQVVRTQLNPIYTALGPAQKHESFDRDQLRGVLFQALGEAKDPAILAESTRIANRVFTLRAKADKSLNSTQADIAINIAAANGDLDFYQKTLALTRYTKDPGIQSDALHLLTRFQSPILVNRTLDYAVSGEVRNQDSWILIATLLAQRETRDQAWGYVRSHWEKVQAQLTTNSGSRIVAAAGSFCTQTQRDQVADFFNTHPVDASERTLAKSLDSIDACIQLRTAQQPNLQHWLAAQPQ